VSTDVVLPAGGTESTDGVAYVDRYENAACGLLTIDNTDLITSANRTFQTWGGYPADLLVGRSFLELLTASGQLFYETRCQVILRLEGEVREVALSMLRLDGEPLPVLINATAVRDDAGDFLETRIAVFDSTQRQDYEKDLLKARRLAESSESRVRMLQDASALFLSADTEDALAAALADTARDAFAASDAAVILYGAAGGARTAAGVHLRPTLLALQAATSAESQSTTPTTVLIGSPAEADAISPGLAQALDESRFKALTAVPLFDGTNLVGALVCLYGREREFDEATLQLHEALARQAALILVRTRLQQELQEMALHDQLTGLANRNLLRERLSHAIASSTRTGQPMALLFLDLDGFKPINDDLGHRVGDAVLQTVADRLNAVIREADVVGRYGGDEFLIVCENADEEAASNIATRVVEAMQERDPQLPTEYLVTASIGVVVHHSDGNVPPSNDALVRRADAAMYESKNAGGNRITLVTI
jgi:diguanylate cyclase (GGDEF)-like protein/PAS domain S-box-containing protein